MYNNILRKDGTTHFKFMRYGGTLTYFPNNWFQDGYEDLHVGATATIIYNTPPLIGTNPGFVNEGSYDFALADNSPCIDQAISLTGIIPAEYLPSMQYDEPANGIPRTMGGSAFDLGALENQDIIPDPNTPPTISSIDDQTINQDESLTDLPFTISDNETIASDLTVSAVSSNLSLVLNSSITFGGSGENRTLSIIPVAGQFGTTEITVTVSDGMLTTSTTFTLIVLEPTADPNNPPTISSIDNYEIGVNMSIKGIAFTVNDDNTSPEKLQVTAVSSNHNLVAIENMKIEGLASDKTISINPKADQFGKTLITITVSDGQYEASEDFRLTIKPPKIGRDEYAFNLINYPNPFKENTTIEYTLNEMTHINIKIYDMKGSFLKLLVSENQAKGTHYIPWDRSTDGGERIQDDLYIYMLTMNKNEVHMGRMMISH